MWQRGRFLCRRRFQKGPSALSLPPTSQHERGKGTRSVDAAEASHDRRPSRALPPAGKGPLPGSAHPQRSFLIALRSHAQGPGAYNDVSPDSFKFQKQSSPSFGGNLARVDRAKTGSLAEAFRSADLPVRLRPLTRAGAQNLAHAGESDFDFGCVRAFPGPRGVQVHVEHGASGHFPCAHRRVDEVWNEHTRPCCQGARQPRSSGSRASPAPFSPVPRSVTALRHRAHALSRR